MFKHEAVTSNIITHFSPFVYMVLALSPNYVATSCKTVASVLQVKIATYINITKK